MYVFVGEPPWSYRPSPAVRDHTSNNLTHLTVCYLPPDTSEHALP